MRVLFRSLHPRGDAPHQVRARPQLRRLLRRVGDCVKDAGEGFDLHVVGVHCPAFQTFGRRADYSNRSEWVPARTKFTRLPPTVSIPLNSPQIWTSRRSRHTHLKVWLSPSRHNGTSVEW